MPRLRSVECMELVNVLQLGTGRMKRSRAQSILSQWKRHARGSTRARRLSQQEWRMKLASSGIGVEVVPNERR